MKSKETKSLTKNKNKNYQVYSVIPCVIVSALINLITSKLVALFGLDNTISACLFKSVLKRLNKSSKSRDINDPANSNLLLP